MKQIMLGTLEEQDDKGIEEDLKRKRLRIRLKLPILDTRDQTEYRRCRRSHTERITLERCSEDERIRV